MAERFWIEITAVQVSMASMDVGGFFPEEGPLGDFSKIFLGEAKNSKICFFPTRN